MGYKTKVILRVGVSELIVRAEQQGLFIVPTGAEVTVAAGERRAPTSLQCGLLCVLLIGRGEVMDGILDHVPRIHSLLQAAGYALHWGTAAWKWGGNVKYQSRDTEEDGQGWEG